MGKRIVVKIGGSTLGSHDTVLEDAVYLQKRRQVPVIVHGGGKLITEWLDKHQIPSRFINGERVTDRNALDVVVSVLAGLVNKDIVATINSLGGQAIGISGVDGALVQGRIKSSELGFVGDVVKVNTSVLEHILEAGYIPVIAPVSYCLPEESADVTRILNINADTVAGEIAAAIGAEKLIFLTDVAGILDKAGNLLSELSCDEVEGLIASGVVSAGMIPKIRACQRAATASGVARIIDGRVEHALLKELEGSGGGGTTIK